MIKKAINIETYAEALKNNTCKFKDIPVAFRDREMCMAAVEQDGTNLLYVPENLKDREMCLIAVKRGGTTLLTMYRKI